jgi:hypothetical protein
MKNDINIYPRNKYSQLKMSNYFNDEFFNYLSENISKKNPSSDELRQLFDKFFISTAKDSDSKKKNTEQKSLKKNNNSNEKDDTLSFIEKNKSKKEPVSKKDVASVVQHKCERIPRGKSEPCGKTAKNSIEVDGKLKWYCGTENAGCYHSILGSSNKKEKNEKSINPPKKAPEDVKSQSLIHKFVKKESIFTRSIMVNGEKTHIHPDSRVLFRRNGKAYGILDKDDKKVLPIDDKNARWLEASNIEIEGKKSKKDEESEEEENEIEEINSEDEIEEDEDVDDEEIELETDEEIELE